MTTLLQNIDEPMEIIIERTAESKEESNWINVKRVAPVRKFYSLPFVRTAKSLLPCKIFLFYKLADNPRKLRWTFFEFFKIVVFIGEKVAHKMRHKISDR